MRIHHHRICRRQRNEKDVVIFYILFFFETRIKSASFSRLQTCLVRNEVLLCWFYIHLYIYGLCHLILFHFYIICLWLSPSEMRCNISTTKNDNIRNLHVILNRTDKDELTCGEMKRRDQLEDQEEADNEERSLSSEMKRRGAVHRVGAGRWPPAESTVAARPAQFLIHNRKKIRKNVIQRKGKEKKRREREKETPYGNFWVLLLFSYFIWFFLFVSFSAVVVVVVAPSSRASPFFLYNTYI